jgi:hypothetical protein
MKKKEPALLYQGQASSCSFTIIILNFIFSIKIFYFFNTYTVCVYLINRIEHVVHTLYYTHSWFYSPGKNSSSVLREIQT